VNTSRKRRRRDAQRQQNVGGAAAAAHSSSLRRQATQYAAIRSMCAVKLHSQFPILQMSGVAAVGKSFVYS